MAQSWLWDNQIAVKKKAAIIFLWLFNIVSTVYSKYENNMYLFIYLRDHIVCTLSAGGLSLESIFKKRWFDRISILDGVLRKSG